jgi:hypothetical protein
MERENKRWIFGLEFSEKKKREYKLLFFFRGGEFIDHRRFLPIVFVTDDLFIVECFIEYFCCNNMSYRQSFIPYKLVY